MKKAQPSNTTGINIGVSKETVTECRAAIMDILRCPNVGETTKVVAMETLTKVCSVNNATVQNCTLSVGTEKK